VVQALSKDPLPTTTGRCTYELPLPATGHVDPAHRAGSASTSAPEPLLGDYVLWFIRLRWVATSVLFLFGALGLAAPKVFAHVGIQAGRSWPFVIAGILLAVNIAFLTHARVLKRRPTTFGIRLNLWSQVIIDLVLLTAVVHFLGSLDTGAPFIFLVHIVLACIFFSRKESVVVTAMACGLYAGCVGLESLGLVTPSRIYMDTGFREYLTESPGFPVPIVLSVVAVWIIVWYLASHLSGLLRERECDLALKNERLTTEQLEKTKHMLRTTHELKAPFAAVHANAELLLRGNFGKLPEEAAQVVERIVARCHRLAHEIQEMLQIANLQSPDVQPQPVTLDISNIARWCIARVLATAGEREIRIDVQLEPVRMVAVEDHMKMLLSNIFSNAVNYSHEGGTVRVKCHAADVGGAVIEVEDDGIGIQPQKLPKIFDDYYRTDEAVRHNRDSSGLGLAIVRRIAETHRIRLTVESAPNCGTRFTLRFPNSALTIDTDTYGKE
jgi:two-component system phosphate regulon sensor histidine kinase PhoR